MNRTKFKITIFALALAFVMSVAAFFGINFGGSRAARAAGTVSVHGSSIFTSFGDGASVYVYKESKEDGGQPDSTDTGYTMFSLGYDSDNISYRKNLAYNWYEQSEEEVTEEGSDETTIVKGDVVNGMFNMEIGFKNTYFEKFIIAFESQQYSKTEDGKTVNYILFFPEGESGVKVLITDDKDATAEDVESNAVLSVEHIYIKFVSKLDGGKYGVIVSNNAESVAADDNSVYGTLENVGGNYAKYSSSSTTPVYPLIFSAKFAEEKENDETAQMVLYRLNNQEFLVKNASSSISEDKHVWSGGTVTDDTPAVLCLNKEISSLKTGGSVSFDYQAIDVLRSSPSAVLHYYILKCEDLDKDDIDFNDHTDDRFVEVESNFLLDSDVSDYLPTLYDDGGRGYGSNFKIDMAVKVFAEVKDTGTNGEVSHVFLDWYIPEDLKLSIGGYDFIAVGENKNGVTFNTSAEKSWDEIVKEYQEKVTEAAKDLSAGSSSYFYVPSAENLFVDDATAYTDMKISIYYYSSTQSSNTSLATNNLSINVSKPGSYRFTLYATDADGNNMYYIDKDGKVVDFSSSEIWEIYGDEDRHDYLPWFEFKVDYKGVEFKEVPGKQNTAYVGTTYTSASFDINGVDGSYTTKYRLFRFERADYYAYTLQTTGKGVTFTYEDFLKVMDDLFENNRTFFYEIKQVNESDEDYEEFKDYNWSSTTTSFTPLDGNAFYYMRAEVTDNEYNTDPVTFSLSVVASFEAKELKGDSEWLQNNVASVILLSVAGVSLVAIILLLVIKPKNKEDIDVQYEKMNEKKGKKSK